MAKYREEYTITDPRTGEPVGPPQVFEADTKDELINKIKAAHQNAAAKFYETKRAVKLGSLLEPDLEKPIQTFEEQQLTADERVKLAEDLKSPATSDAAFTRMLEAKLGAPIETIRNNFRQAEIDKRVKFTYEQINDFKEEHPDYVECKSNQDTIVKYLNKKGWPITKKNLEIAYADLVEDELLVLRTPTPAEPENKMVEVAPVATEEVPPAQTDPAVITQETDPNKQNSESEVRPKASSSGLGRNNSSVGNTPKTKEITESEANAFRREVDSLSADQYSKRLQDPEFRKRVEELYTVKKK